MKVAQIDYQGHSIYYQTIGSGSPIFLIHGFGEDARIWDEINNELINHFSIITFDLPGCGLNKHCNPSLCSIENAANIVVAILVQLNLTSVSLVGHSMGGYIALAIAKKAPSLIKKISLVHSSIFADDENKKIARQKNINFIENHDAALFLKQTIPNLFSEHYVTNNRKWLDNFIANISYLTKEILINYTESMMNRLDSTDFVKNTDIPIQFIAGTEDKAVPYLTSLKQCYMAKISYFHKLNGVGHMGMFEDTKQVTNELLFFHSKA